MNNYQQVLSEYLPQASIEPIYQWLIKSNVQLTISKSRRTKLGDYRPPQGRYAYHKISVNHDLNKYHFLITLMHEIAHLMTWEKYQKRVMPHGREWKENFKKSMQPFLTEDVFPPEILPVLIRHLENPTSSTADQNLIQVLRKHDVGKSFMVLDDLPMHAVFQIKNGRQFIKMEKRRTRYRCQRLDNKRFYLVNSMAEVVQVDPG